MVANGTIRLTSIGALKGAYIYGAGLFKANGDIVIHATATGDWAHYQDDSRIIHSMAGNISITANGGYGIYVNGGGIVAGNSTTAPKSTLYMRLTTGMAHTSPGLHAASGRQIFLAAKNIATSDTPMKRG